MRRADLVEALAHIANGRGLTPYNAADYKELAGIEGVAHELAHAIDLGKDFELSLRAMSARQRNAREVSTLKIEIAALRELGVNLSPRRLHTTAVFDDRRPPLQRIVAPLTRHERRCARLFVDEVRATHDRVRAAIGAAP